MSLTTLSMYIMNNSGDNALPCLTPHPTLYQLPSCTLLSHVLYSALIAFSRLLGTLYSSLSRTAHIRLLGTRSKAFSRSKNAIYCFKLNSHDFSISIFSVNIKSIVLLFGLNPYCHSPNSDSTQLDVWLLLTLMSNRVLLYRSAGCLVTSDPEECLISIINWTLWSTSILISLSLLDISVYFDSN